MRKQNPIAGSSLVSLAGLIRPEFSHFIEFNKCGKIRKVSFEGMRHSYLK